MNQEQLMDEQSKNFAHNAEARLINCANECSGEAGVDLNPEIDIDSYCAEIAGQLGTPLPSMDFQDFETLLPDVPISKSIRIKCKRKSKLRVARRISGDRQK